MPLPSLLAARDAIRAKDVSSDELVRAALAAIDQHDQDIKAFVSTDAQRALRRAANVDAGSVTGPLAGVPIAVKDNLCTSWGTTTCSSKMLEHFKSPYDATAIRKLEEAGAVIVGKTNLDEFAMGSSTENSAFGSTRNPWDTDRVPGGSSGGSAAALAAGFCVGSIGSDTGGSIRQPASLCGTVGIKPTYGRVSRYGLVAFASSLDQIGPFAWTVSDAALLLNVLCGHDPLDSTSAPVEVPDFVAEAEKLVQAGSAKGLRIGIAKEFTSAAEQSGGVDPEVQAAFDAALAVLQEHGAEVVDVSLPHTEYGIAAYYVIAPCEASSNLARYDGVHFGHRTSEPVQDIIELFSKSREEGFGPEVKRRIMIGTYALSSGYYDAYYNTALKVRTRIAQDFEQAFQKCDVIASPTSPFPAFKVGEKAADPLSMYLCDVFTVTSNIAGNCSMSVPCGFTSGEKPLPIGLHLIGPAFAESKMLQAGRLFESVTDFHTKRPVFD
ncbi:MAG: Asp-tRNA(Asn)/Glu-tRNA(Gln) amidotransferase subunit GatA [Planctomycetota bacterium]